MSTPQTKLKSKFDSKEKLVAAVKALTSDELWVPRLNKDRGGSKGLAQVSNAKLLKLHATFSTVQSQFGTRAKLIDAVLEVEGRSKDGGYRTRLEAYAVPRLFDLYTAKARKAGILKNAAVTKVAKAKVAKAPATKKPATKSSATKASATKSSATKAPAAAKKPAAKKPATK